MTTPIKVEQVSVTPEDHEAARKVIPAAVIFADDEEHVADLRARAAIVIAQVRIAAEAKTREEDARIAEGLDLKHFDPLTGGHIRCAHVASVAAAIRSRMETNNGR